MTDQERLVGYALLDAEWEPIAYTPFDHGPYVLPQKKARKAREAKAERVPFGFARALAEDGDR